MNRHKFWQFVHWPDHAPLGAAKAIPQRSGMEQRYFAGYVEYIPKAWRDSTCPAQSPLHPLPLRQYAQSRCLVTGVRPEYAQSCCVNGHAPLRTQCAGKPQYACQKASSPDNGMG